MTAEVTPQSGHGGQREPGYERQDVNLRSLLLVGLAIAAVIVAILWFMNEYFVVEREQLVYEKVLKPENPRLRALHEREEEVLNNYAVIDPEKGIYQIPIERAMELLASEASRQSSRQRR